MLAEKESMMVVAKKLAVELCKEQEVGLSLENKAMSGQVEWLNYNNKEGTITIDILKEQNQGSKSKLQELKNSIVKMKTSQKDMLVEN
jgi:kinesin family member 5